MKIYPIKIKVTSILVSIELFLKILIQFLNNEKCCEVAILCVTCKFPRIINNLIPIEVKK